MRRVALALGLVAFVAILLVIGWRREPAEETTTLAAPATTTTTATTTTIPPAELVEISAAQVTAEGAAGEGLDPVVLAISGAEAWAVVSTLEDLACVIAHHHYGAWEYWRLADANRVRDLAVAPNGTIWAAADSGAFSFDGHTWVRRFDGPVGGIAVDAQGTVWIAGSLEGDFPTPWLARGNGEQWERLDDSTREHRAGTTPIALGPGGEAWVSVRPGHRAGDLMRFDGTYWQAMPVADFPDPEGDEGAVAVYTLEVAPDGSLWVGGWPSADWEQVVLARFDGAAWELYDWPADHTGVTALFFELAVAPDGLLWVGAQTGLFSFDGTDWTRRTIDGTWVEDLDLAPDGTLWYSDEAGLHSRRPPSG